MELLTTITANIAHAGIELLEIAAMGILLFGSGKAIWMLIRHKPHVTLGLTRFMNIALIIMLCAEIVRLVLVRTPWSWPSWRAWWCSTAPSPSSSPGRWIGSIPTIRSEPRANSPIRRTCCCKRRVLSHISQ